MTCSNPLIAVSVGKNSCNKHKLAFIDKGYSFIKDLKIKYGSDNVFTLPCGQCDECRASYSEEWSIRCCLEAQYHLHNYFITLTYDDASLKFANNKDLRKFIDRVELLDKNLKYFACKEYGELTSRMHWHIILFTNVDLQLYDPVKIGDFFHYHSHILNNKWHFGHHDIAPFDKDCARYVAKYTNKDHQPIFLRKEKRVFMSRNLGFVYFENHFEDIINDNFYIYGKFGDRSCIHVPYCFYRWYEDKYGIDCSLIKSQSKAVQKSINLDAMINSCTVFEEDKRKTAIAHFARKKKGVRNGSL